MKKIVSQLSAIMFVGALVFTTSCKREVVVTADKTSVAIGEIVRFQAIEDDSKLKGSYITWDFGDGDFTKNQSTVAEIYDNTNRVSAVWAYSAAGTYKVTAVVNKSRRPTKKNAKTTFGTVEVTVNSVTPAFEIQDVLGAVITTSRDDREIFFVNKTEEGTVAQASFNYQWIVNGTVQSSSKNFSWMADAGTYKVKLKLTQGSTVTYSAEQTLIVDGADMTENEMQALIGGKWTVTMTGTGTGAGYTSLGTTGNYCVFGTTAVAPKLTAKMSTVYLRANDGEVTWSVSAETATSGNILDLPGIRFDVVNSTTIKVTGISSTSFEGSPNGLYTVTKVDGSSMTLKRTDKQEYNGAGTATCPTTDEK